jgi:hypothetical protein
MIKKYLLPAALFIGLVGDLLFWKKSPGISYPIFMVLCLAVAFTLLRLDEHYPARRVYWLFGMIVIFSAFTAIRKDPLTSFANVVLSFLLTLLLSDTYESGAWLDFNLSDYFNRFFHILGQVFILPWKFLFIGKENPDDEDRKAGGSIAWQVLRGFLLAIPILLVFIFLLSSADLVFAHWVEGISQYFKVENLRGYLCR